MVRSIKFLLDKEKPLKIEDRVLTGKFHVEEITTKNFRRPLIKTQPRYYFESTEGEKFYVSANRVKFLDGNLVLLSDQPKQKTTYGFVRRSNKNY